MLYEVITDAGPGLHLVDRHRGRSRGIDLLQSQLLDAVIGDSAYRPVYETFVAEVIV